MKNLLIIGTSHVGSLKMGWEAIKQEFEGVEVSFFGAKTSCYRAAKAAGIFNVDGRLLRPCTKELAESFAFTSGHDSGAINPSAYDGILLYGFRPQLDPSLYLHCSSQFRKAYLAEGYSKSLLLKVLNGLKKAGGENLAIMVSQPPFPVLPAKSGQGKTTGLNEFLGNLDDDYQLILSKQFKEVHFVKQPLSTVDSETLGTKAYYSNGSLALQVDDSSPREHPEKDNKHMNQEYGQLFMAELLKTLWTERSY